jgi:hypothetical protein
MEISPLQRTHTELYFTFIKFWFKAKGRDTEHFSSIYRHFVAWWLIRFVHNGCLGTKHGVVIFCYIQVASFSLRRQINYECVELYVHPPNNNSWRADKISKRYDFMASYLVKHRDNFTLMQEKKIFLP